MVDGTDIIYPYLNYLNSIRPYLNLICLKELRFDSYSFRYSVSNPYPIYIILYHYTHYPLKFILIPAALATRGCVPRIIIGFLNICL